MPKSLLLADDSITIQRVVGITFANEDFEITTVDNGEDAINKAKEMNPDIILADVIMPKKNGYEVCQAIKADPNLQSTPVLLLAGTFEAFDENRAKEVGADGHITKPFESQALIDKVNDLLSGKSPAQVSTQPTPEIPQPVPAPVQPAPTQPAPVQPQPAAPVQPAPVQPTPQQAPVPPPPIEPRPLEQTTPETFEPAPIEPTPLEPKPLEPKPLEPKPLEPKPLEPKPLEPKPLEPKPLEPKPLEPKPLEPKPLEPKPLEPKPLEPKPLEPKPLEPKPLEPKPLEPKPLEPKPLEPEPLEPEPLEPEPFSAPESIEHDIVQTQPPVEPELSPSIDTFEPPPTFGDNPTPSPVSAFEPEMTVSEPDASLDIEEQPPVDLAPESPQDTTDSLDDLPAVDIDESGLSDEAPELAPMHDFIPNANEVGEPVKDLGPEKPEPIDIENQEDKDESKGASLPKQDLERIAREVMEKIAWEIVPQLAETIIREEIEKLVQEKLSD